jgi:hypothetical protein
MDVRRPALRPWNDCRFFSLRLSPQKSHFLDWAVACFRWRLIFMSNVQCETRSGITILEGYFDSSGPRDRTIVVAEAEVAAADMWKSKLARKGENKERIDAEEEKETKPDPWEGGMLLYFETV